MEHGGFTQTTLRARNSSTITLIIRFTMRLTEPIPAMQTVHFFAAFVAALVCVEVTKGDDCPNMIFVMSDDQGWGDVAYKGIPF